MEEHGYKDLAKYYDLFTEKKDYKGESEFLVKLLNKYNVKTLLDVGCGTGNHLINLEKKFNCKGFDLNEEMITQARKKLNSKLFVGDMKSFQLNERFEAIICMFAGFNHIIDQDDVIKALKNFYKHLNFGGLLVLDLHNPKSSGEKVNSKKGISRKMQWSFDKNKMIEKTIVTFDVNGKIIEDSHNMKIYTIEEMRKLLEKEGFREISFFENYTFVKANQSSKNIVVAAVK